MKGISLLIAPILFVVPQIVMAEQSFHCEAPSGIYADEFIVDVPERKIERRSVEGKESYVLMERSLHPNAEFRDSGSFVELGTSGSKTVFQLEKAPYLFLSAEEDGKTLKLTDAFLLTKSICKSSNP